VVYYRNRFAIKYGAMAISGVGAPFLGDPSSIGPALKLAHDLGVDLVMAINEKRVISEPVAERNRAMAYLADRIKKLSGQWVSDHRYYAEKD